MQDEIRIIGEADGLAVRFFCEIDHHTARSVRGRIDRAVTQARPRSLILDLTDVRFMDSSGLGLILGRLALCRELGIPLRVRGASDAVMKIVRLAGVDRADGIGFEAAPAFGKL